MRGIRRRGVLGVLDDLVDFLRRDRRLSAPPGRILPTPRTPSTGNWRRQPSTVDRDTPNRSAITAFARPSAANNSPVASRTIRYGYDGDDAIASWSRRSSSVNSNGFRRSIRHTPAKPQPRA